MFEFFDSLHWGAVAQFVVIDILLGGEAAGVSARACGKLPAQAGVRGGRGGAGGGWVV
ncbi:TerC family protein, partial [Burkholderia pseudomallei]